MREPDSRKIAFICNTNDPEAMAECARFIRALDVPEGYAVEIVPVEGATGMASGYNEGMRRTDARYKVYLHQDVLILNRSLIPDLLRLFEREPRIGLVGVTGARTLPMHGVWWESSETVGRVFGTVHGRVQAMDFGDFDDPFCFVEAVDGLFMATQVDLPWRDDVADGWHFYDITQCMEFLKAGYRIAVPRQRRPWCLHDCGVSHADRSFLEAKRKFFTAYGPQLQQLRGRMSIGSPS